MSGRRFFFKGIIIFAFFPVDGAWAPNYIARLIGELVVGDHPRRCSH